jgi:hypothetical protein
MDDKQTKLAISRRHRADRHRDNSLAGWRGGFSVPDFADLYAWVVVRIHHRERNPFYLGLNGNPIENRVTSSGRSVPTAGLAT